VLHERWNSTFGVELLDGLGTAEMWHIFLSNLPGRVRPGTIGVPVPGFEVDVRDADGGRLPAGEVGALWVRGNSRAIGYWRNMERTKSVFRGEWVVTGDLVSRDDDGYFTYAGRDDDAMKVKGRWLLPAEVEDCLLQHPSVLECGVVGVPDPAGLVKPVAFVAAPGATSGLADELRQFALERLEPYKHPRRVVVLDQLPRTHLGKIDRSRLRDLASTSEPAE
jgi:acyl-coenzyme A synthetase/AMP-(fatty) acid ligase